MFERLRMWLKQFDWGSIFGSALVLVIALWFFVTYPNNITNPEPYQSAFKSIIGVLSAEGWTALGTILLALATLFLTGVTRTAANAARDAAEALPKLERAYIFINVRSDDITRAFKFRPNVIATLHLINVGRTPAIVKKISRIITVAKTPEDFPDSWIFESARERIVPQGTVTGPDEGDYSQIITASIRPITKENIMEDGGELGLTDDEFNALKDDKSFLWLGCVAVYDDVFDKEHITARLIRFSSTKPNGEDYSDKNWNYRT